MNRILPSRRWHLDMSLQQICRSPNASCIWDVTGGGNVRPWLAHRVQIPINGEGLCDSNARRHSGRKGEAGLTGRTEKAEWRWGAFLSYRIQSRFQRKKTFHKGSDISSASGAWPSLVCKCGRIPHENRSVVSGNEEQATPRAEAQPTQAAGLPRQVQAGAARGHGLPNPLPGIVE